LERTIQNIITAKKLSDISSCKKLIGFKNAYRLRIGNYRIGFFFENEKVELIRILNRKNIYRYFP
jgi:mRNA-degrading endonuclease RelE of RelBE toxin-antitoxin system